MTSTQPDPSAPLVFECDFDEPPEKLWRALTEPRLLAAWLAPETPPRTEYEVLTAEPPRLLRYRWRDREDGAGGSSPREVHSVVTFELIPAPAGGTHLRLTHGEFRSVAAVPRVPAARVRPLTHGRTRRRLTSSLAARAYWRRAA
jgi:uncharacterized protein YndB with AHSA1/START domain